MNLSKPIKISYYSIITFFFSFLFFFPEYYANSFTQYAQYIFWGISLFYLLTWYIGRNRNYNHSIDFATIVGLIFFIYLYIVSVFCNVSYGSFATVKVLIRFAVYMLFLNLSISNDKNGTINALYLAFLIIVGIDVIGILLHPEGIYFINDGESDCISGWLLGNKNNHTEHFILFILLTLWKTRNQNNIKNELWLIIATGLCVCATIIMQSSTSISTMILIALSVVVSILKLKKPNLNYKIILIALLILNVLILAGNTAFLSPVTEYFGKDLTFTNRTVAWERTLVAIISKPIFGYGYIDGREARSIIKFLNPHNQILDCLLNGGIVLLLYFIFILFKTAGKINRIEDRNKKFVLGLFLTAIVVKMIFEQVVSEYVFWVIVFVLIKWADDEESNGRRDVLVC